MKNHFFIGYAGNKRQEVNKIYEHLDLNKIDTIIEPFCGTSAMSFYIASLHPKKFKYILNDYDNKLIELYKISLDEEAFKILCNELNEDYSKIITKNQYLEYIKKDNLKAYLIKKRFTL
jgi:site-specific DNA-adenine methylase